ncbi:PREDICTED: uncharacterized protein LOC109581152 [Amphimedon queenslandica]|uniref:Fibrinogen C-terminal domain-containing protein n=1 Tax=Amphimedon queenslandica TaxID=400682 RepID=A0AAN0J1E5_AMPQE|nr:PREDICTED: uncharacterized protein LOC109581152 [Amphimedon queenslandica]|eukprot:XP_019850551.1 PREDICTED: uncharacterized protein LOC109581152 [Amphimedon queenslandica]
MMLSSILLLITCLQVISGSDFAFTFDANKNKCTATASTSSDRNHTHIILSNNTVLLEELLNATRQNAQAIKEIKSMINGGHNSCEAINDILLLVEELIMLHNDSSSFSPIPSSCQEIKNKQPNSPSGVYLLETATNGTQYIYCNMEELCGSGGGWTRLAYLNMTDSTENCPSGFRLYQSGGVRACGRVTSSEGSCVSVEFPSNGISYSQVCGRVVGYQFASPDAVDNIINGPESHNDINSYYVDGVSITRGSPRQHVWTLMAGVSGGFSTTEYPYNCPCSTGSLQSSKIQSFVGNDYYCESGAGNTWTHIFYPSDPLWDGQGCGSIETACCNVPGIPWFHRDYGNTTTTDYLELRVCANQDTGDEDTPVAFYEIYVK